MLVRIDVSMQISASCLFVVFENMYVDIFRSCKDWDFLSYSCDEDVTKS
jgi:hypothetical protein